MAVLQNNEYMRNFLLVSPNDQDTHHFQRMAKSRFANQVKISHPKNFTLGDPLNKSWYSSVSKGAKTKLGRVLYAQAKSMPS
mmetsp:Transcript_40291/g.61487  ORF Transcript_40291/g.61487 Transcript_40291/m.61487 type:complete len:82 (-) Transcript_40291:1028-1273(-)